MLFVPSDALTMAGADPPVTLTPAAPRNWTNVGVAPSAAFVTPAEVSENVSPETVDGAVAGVAVPPAETTMVSGVTVGVVTGSGLVEVPLPALCVRQVAA